ncbi:MAG: DUF3613 domain-containing protein [Panacagrimonas sp.]
MMMKRMVVAMAMTLPLLVGAQEQATDKAALGAETRSWTDLQTSNASASAVPRPMSGDIAERVYDRYANSYSYPIPEQLGREGFVTEGGE